MYCKMRSKKTVKSEYEYDFTALECKAWRENPLINPRTKRPISATAKNGVYKQLELQCKRANKRTNKKVVEADQVKHAQDKYCRCLMHVRPKAGNPYGICTSSVIQLHNVPRPKYCEYQDFSKFTKDELLAYAEEKKKWIKADDIAKLPTMKVGKIASFLQKLQHDMKAAYAPKRKK